MKIYFEYSFKSGPWGGGNQFLKNLYNELKDEYLVTDKKNIADIIIFNSHHNLKKILYLKFLYPNKTFIHRIDGPLDYRGIIGRKLDNYIFRINNLVADATIFQSKWSKNESFKKGYKKNKFEQIIPNAANNNLFKNDNKNYNLNKKKKIKLISASWSTNINKGFDIYKFLDNNLNFDKYEMTFIGNSPDSYNNIISYEPVNNSELVKFFVQSDIFIFPSKYESCSNLLNEALNCKLPSLVYNSSSNPEFIYSCGELFNDSRDLIPKLDFMVENYSNYNNFSNLISLKEVSSLYKDFFNFIIDTFKSKKYTNKKINIYNLFKYMFYKL